MLFATILNQKMFWSLMGLECLLVAWPLVDPMVYGKQWFHDGWLGPAIMMSKYSLLSFISLTKTHPPKIDCIYFSVFQEDVFPMFACCLNSCGSNCTRQTVIWWSTPWQNTYICYHPKPKSVLVGNMYNGFTLSQGVIGKSILVHNMYDCITLLQGVMGTIMFNLDVMGRNNIVFHVNTWKRINECYGL